MAIGVCFQPGRRGAIVSADDADGLDFDSTVERYGDEQLCIVFVAV